MARTTLDLDPTVLAELRDLSRHQRRSMSELASELLAGAMSRPTERPQFRWISRPMGALVDIEDKEALRRAMDET